MTMNIQPPGNLDLHSANLPQTWRCWKDGLELYLDLVMNDQSEEKKLKFILYLIGTTEGREIYSTMSFDTAEGERTVVELLQVFGAHCHPRNSEMVERCHFFTRDQETGEKMDKSGTKLQIRAATCNFGIVW